MCCILIEHQCAYFYESSMCLNAYGASVCLHSDGGSVCYILMEYPCVNILIEQ